MNINREGRNLIADNISKSDLEKNKQSLINRIRSNSNFVLLTNIKKVNLKILSMLTPAISEICDCLTINANQASITLTNHLLERTLKTAIILDESKCNLNDRSLRVDEVFKDSYDKYDGVDMEVSINKCCSLGLINKSEKEHLKKFKLKFRNPYSHAQTNEILKGVTSEATIGYLDKSKETEMQNLNVGTMPILHGDALLAISKKNAFDYFMNVFYYVMLIDQELEVKLKTA